MSVTSVPAFAEALAEAVAHHLGGRQGQRIVHPGRTEQADRAGLDPVDRDRHHHDGAGGQRLDTVLGADGHRESGVQDVPQERDHHQLLLEDGQHRAHGVHGVEGGGHA